jgi:hypothetical protein
VSIVTEQVVRALRTPIGEASKSTTLSCGPGIATPNTIDAAIARHSRSHGEQADPLPHADGRPAGEPGSAATRPPDPRILALGEETERHPHGGELLPAIEGSKDEQLTGYAP